MSDSKAMEQQARDYIMRSLAQARVAIQAAEEQVLERMESARDAQARAEKAMRMGQEEKALGLIDDIEILSEDLQPTRPDLAQDLRNHVRQAREDMQIDQKPPGERDWFKALIAGKGAMTVIATLQNKDLEEKFAQAGHNGLARSIERKFEALNRDRMAMPPETERAELAPEKIKKTEEQAHEGKPLNTAQLDQIVQAKVARELKTERIPMLQDFKMG